MAAQHTEELQPVKSDGLEDVEIADKHVNAGGSGDKGVVNQMEIQPAFVGLGKEDLLQLANSPFWVRLRWILFITFWIMWLGLLVGAALIIGLSPGCTDEMKTASAGKAGSHHR